MIDEQTAKKAASGRLGGLKSKGRKAPRVYCQQCSLRAPSDAAHVVPGGDDE